MRIGYFIPGWPPSAIPNGIATTLGRLGEQLLLNGHEVFYVTGHLEGRTRDERVWVTDGSTNLVEKLHLKWDFEGALFRKGSNSIADVVETLVRHRGLEIFQMEETHGLGLAVIRRVQIPVVIKLDGPWFLHGPFNPLESRKRENLRRVEREGQAIHSAAGITAPSQDVLNRVESFYGLPKCPVEVIPPPIRPSVRWTPDSCDRNLILFVGRFSRHKGADILIRAFAKVAKNRKAAKLLLVGPDEGLQSDGGIVNLPEYLTQQIPLAVRERIKCLGKLPDQGEIEKLRTQACLTIVCSRYETFGNTVLEAMAAGCPTIATNAGGIPEMIIHNRNGLLVDVEDVDGLAAAVTKMLDDPALACKLGEQAARDCQDWFDVTKVAERTVSFYSRVIKSHGGTEDHLSRRGDRK